MAVTSADRLPTVPARGPRGWVRRHPVAAFFVLAYALSWLVWIPASLAGAGQALLVVGAFGPAVAAYIVLRITGGSVRAWARQILRWRVQLRWYLYALGLPALLFAVVNGALALLGKPIDLALLGERAPSYLAGLAFITLLGGGQEEPGWRGFALPRLQLRLTPLRSTLVLGALWGLWHLPIYGIGFVGPMLFAVFYLTPDNLTVDLTILAVLVAATVVLVVVTRGRLGFSPTSAQVGAEQ